MITMMRTRGVTAALLAWGSLATAFVACTDHRLIEEGDTEPGTGTGSNDGTTELPPGPADDTGVDDTSVDDSGSSTEEPPPGPECAMDGDCPKIDLLFVIDNSGTMREEQRALSNDIGAIVEVLRNLTDESGAPAYPDVNVMVTTTDMGHPACEPFQKPDYTPARGAPIYSGCNFRINRFIGLDPMDVVVAEDACRDNCPSDIVAADHYVHFDALGSNVPDDDVAAALQCVLPQGVDGCGYEAPLESMVQALDPGKCWNDPGQPACDEDPEWADVEHGFLRPGAVLGVVLLTDELDCSVAAPGGYSFFTDVNNSVYWSFDPQMGFPRASSAICFNAGVTCEDVDDDGTFESCDPVDTGVLHPIDRYTSFLQYFVDQGRPVVMMGAVGLPPVLAHNPDPNYEPISGGLVDVEYRKWIDGPYPRGDIDPERWLWGDGAEELTFGFGDLGPACHREDSLGNYGGWALPPVRIREVCESVNFVDDGGRTHVRCCLESICGDDFGPAFRCLTDAL